MKKVMVLGVAMLIVLLVGVGIWWLIWGEQDKALNENEAFVYSAEGQVHWLELNSRFGKVKGKLHQQELIEEIGEEPIIADKEYTLTGKTTEKGYQFQVTMAGKTVIFEAWFSENHLLMQEQGDRTALTYKPVNKEELKQYEKDLQEELETAIYHAEEKEKNRKRTFFSELEQVFGYLYSNEDFQLLLKIDKGYPHGGEIEATLLTMEATENENTPYEEQEYKLNGITDGLMIELFTEVEGQSKKMKGKFIAATVGLNLSFWKSDHDVKLDAVTETEFEQSKHEFIDNLENS